MFVRSRSLFFLSSSSLIILSFCSLAATQMSVDSHPDVSSWSVTQAPSGDGIAGSPQKNAIKITFSGADHKPLATQTYSFYINSTKKAQPYLGVGSSFDSTSAYNLWRLDHPKGGAFSVEDLGPKANQVIQTLFGHGDNDFGWNLMRIPFGTSDFTMPCSDLAGGGSTASVCPGNDPRYSFEDVKGQFSITPENRPLAAENLKVMQAAQAIAKNKVYSGINFFGSTWSAPRWMKDSGSMRSGYFKASSIPDMVDYYSQTITQFAKAGIPIKEITLFNEPNVAGGGSWPYPNTNIKSDDYTALFCATHDAFAKQHLDVKLWSHDSNYSTTSSNLDPVCHGQSVADGIAFHNYSGVRSNMLDDRNQRHKNVYLTEYHWGSSYSNQQHTFDQGAYGAEQLLSMFHFGASSYTNWATIHFDGIDQSINTDWWPKGWPHNPVNISDSNGKLSVEYNFMDYAMAAISKFVQPGNVDDPTKSSYILASSPSSVSGITENNFFSKPDFFNSPTTVYSGDCTKVGRASECLRGDAPNITAIDFINPDYAKYNLHQLVSVIVNKAADPEIVNVHYDATHVSKYFTATLPANSVTTFTWNSSSAPVQQIVVSGGKVSKITATSATVSWTVNDTYGGKLSSSVAYHTGSDTDKVIYGQCTEGDKGIYQCFANLKGLAVNSNYLYTVKASDGVHTANTKEATFKTKTAQGISISGNTASNITDHSVTLGWKVSDTFGGTMTSSVAYGKGVSAKGVCALTQSGEYNCQTNIESLDAGTSYDYIIHAVDGSHKADQKGSFKTTGSGTTIKLLEPIQFTHSIARGCVVEFKGSASGGVGHYNYDNQPTLDTGVFLNAPHFTSPNIWDLSFKKGETGSVTFTVKDDNHNTGKVSIKVPECR